MNKQAFRVLPALVGVSTRIAACNAARLIFPPEQRPTQASAAAPCQHLVIGNVIGRSTRGCEEHQRTAWQSPAESLDGATAQVGVPSYLLDLRGAPTEVARWLDQEH